MRARTRVRHRHWPAPHAREPCVRMLPQSLTLVSCKRSPNPPEKAHPRLLETLTEVSRMSSPTPPADPHQRVPERLTSASRRCSPAAPEKAHRTLPYRLTALPRKSSLAAPEKPHLCDDSESAKPECGCECARAHRVKRLCGAASAARSKCFRTPCVRRYRRSERARYVRTFRTTGRPEYFAPLNGRMRNAVKDWRHRRHAMAPRFPQPTDSTAATSS